MRIILRRGDGEPLTIGFPALVAGLLVLLAVVGGGGAAVVSSMQRNDRSVDDRMGPKRNYANLPEMAVSVGAGQTMDLKFRLEIDPTVDPHVADRYASRIADRLGDSLRVIDPQRWRGSDGAKLMKTTVASAVNREVSSLQVRDVVLERMVIH